MKLRTLLFAGGLAILSSLSVKAQTAHWVIRPQYSSISTYSDQLYKVKSGYMTGLMDKSGKLVVPVTADSITDMRNGHALALKYTSEGRFKLMGILHHDLSYTNIMKDYYVGDYPFYSEDMLPVYNEKDRLGYLDPNGREVIEFNLVEAHPFCEGVAAVSRAKKGIGAAVDMAGSALSGKYKPKGTVGYVKNDGKFVVIQKNLGKLEQAYSFRHGEALVVTEDGRMCFINTRGQFIREDRNVVVELDDVYAFHPNYSQEMNQEKFVQTFNGPTIFADGNKIGYRNGGKIILPPQFTHAYPFSNGYAVAAVDGKYGVLNLVDVEFKHNPKFSKMENSSDQMLDYELQIPSQWGTVPLTMYCKLKNGTESNCVLQPSASDKRVFVFSVPAGEKPTFRLEGDNLVIWEESMSGAASSVGKDDLDVAILSGAVKANAKDNATVVVRITNNTSNEQEVTVSISGQKVIRVNKNVTIPAGGAEKVYATYTNVLKKGTYELTVKLSNGKTVTRTITVSPFFN